MAKTLFQTLLIAAMFTPSMVKAMDKNDGNAQVASACEACGDHLPITNESYIR